MIYRASPFGPHVGTDPRLVAKDRLPSARESKRALRRTSAQWLEMLEKARVPMALR